MNNQIRNHKNANNTECAPESPAEPAGFILRMFQPYVRRSREETSMFRSSCLNLQHPAKIAPFPD